MKKIIVISIICFFVGLGFQPAFANDMSTNLEKEQLVVFENTISQYNDVFEAYALVPYWPEGQEGLYGFDLDTPGTLEYISDGQYYYLLSGACFVPPCYIYFRAYAHGMLWTFNIITLEFSLIGGYHGDLKGVDYDDESGCLYAVGERGLYRIDIETGEGEYIGNWGSSHLIIAIAINEGIAYGHDVLNDAIYIINLDTAELTLLGETGLDSYNFSSDMAFDKDNDTLYLTSYNSSSALYTCNTTNGNCTLVGDFEGGAEVTAIAIPYYNYTQPPYGPTEGKVNISYTYCVDLPDYGGGWGSSCLVMWDWGDGTMSDWLGPYGAGKTVCEDHSWSEPGSYEIRVRIKVTCGRDYWTDPLIVNISENSPPSKPTIDGPMSGNPNTEYEFTFNATDPEGDAVMYNVDWGDSDTEWTEYGDSGVEVTLKHTWEASGKYTIKAKAIDIHGAESEWAEFTVTMPRDKAVTSNMLLLKILERFPLLQKLLQQFGT